jgi:hypothetical protein
MLAVFTIKIDGYISSDFSRNGNVNLLFMEPYKRICLEIGEIYCFSFRNNVRVFSHHEPAAVREEESSSGVVRVGVGIRVFVVLAVITYPDMQIVLRK